MQMKPLAAGIASLGRGNDKMLVHMTPGEVAGLQAIAMKHGGSLTINPHTGLPEAGFLSSILPTIAGIGLNAMFPGLGALGTGLLVGGLGALTSGSLSKGLMAGLGAYGGAGLGGALSDAGLNAFQQEAVQRGMEESGLRALEAGNAASGSAVNDEIMRRAMTAPESMVGAGMGQMDPMEYARLVQNTGGMESMLPGGPTEEVIRQSAAESAMNAAPGPNSAAAQQAAKVQWNEMTPMDRLGRSWDAAKSGNVDFNRDIIGQAANKKTGAEKTGLGGWGGAATTLGIAAAPALAYGAYRAAQQPTLRGLPSLTSASTSSSTPSQYGFNRGEINPRFGEPGQPYFLDRGFTPFAEGGTVPKPNDMYPQASLERSAYATSAQTPLSTEVVNTYAPHLNPFSGEPQGMAAGGIAGVHEYAAGGRLLDGPGDGMSDDIPAVIKGPKPQRAALADSEFVLPADVVSHLGNGSTKAGAKRLYAMMDRVRMARTGRKKQSPQINADRYLPA
jgi:hypothetical protein